MYITAIAPSLATVVTAIAMFIKIVSRTKEMAASLKDDAQKKLQEAMDAQYALLETLKEEIKRITDSNEMAQMKEQYARVMSELEDLTRQNAELLAKLNMRGY